MIDRQILILRLLLPFLLLGAVAAVETAGGSAEQTVMTGIMTGDAADHGTLQAPLGFGGTGGRNRKSRGDKKSGDGFHDDDPF